MSVSAVNVEQLCVSEGFQILETDAHRRLSFHVNDVDGSKSIFVPTSLSSREKRLAMAELLGQSLMSGNNMPVANDTSLTEYALCLLMPAPTLEKVRQMGISTEEASELLDVPVRSLQWRMADLGL